MTIKPGHAKTCKWLLKCSQYVDWLDASKLDEHHGFLWIKGKAGAGKSTLMKFATVNARKTMRDCTVLTFFFNARGEDLEKSTIGTYRSLLLQLLEAIPESHSIFSSSDFSKSPISADQQWSVEMLETLLEQAIQSLGQSSVVCFIDALDECEEGQVRKMIQFLERISDIAVSNDLHFKVCFSSRHYPHVTIRNGLELVLEGHEGHTQDITNYIGTELKIGKSKAAQRIRSELQEKASGVFMWVVLVVDILNKEFDRGQVHALRKKLQEIPGDLHELFRDILTRDSHNKELLVLCIQWVLFARRPLSPEELYHVLLSSADPDVISDWDPEDVTIEDMRRYILNSSKGLTEATAVKNSRIQFIHESVRDFLLKENGLSKIWPEFKENFQGQSHERLKQCCYDYNNLAATSSAVIPDHLQDLPAEVTAHLRKVVTRLFPCLDYAVRNVLHHADQAEGSGVSQKGFLASFSISEWVKLDNLLEKHKVRRHTSKVSLLYILAELDLVSLAKVLNSANQCINVEAERYGCPLFAAAAMSNEKIVNLLMRSLEIQQADTVPGVAVEDHTIQGNSSQRASKRDFVYSRSKTLLMNAADLGHGGVFALLLRSGQFGIDAEESKALLWKAIKSSSERTVRLLLSADPSMVNSKNRAGETALYVAAEEGNKAIIQIFLDGGADIDIEGGLYGNALHIASVSGHKGVVELLLDKGVNVSAQGGYYGNALQAASFAGHTELVELMLDKGANVNAQGGYYGNVLQAATARGYKKLIELLLDKGANVSAQGGYYGNALQAASACGSKEIVELLLDKGADVHAQGGFYGNALHAALERGRKEIAELLEEWGATKIPE
ncbi:hypothetical protein E8E12_002429 [Didymella heteroderae]|uniref:Nephrocystin 3-like N-terminal domain-containing protein n=1 Tax=Didymella heteroderae TaxID=1769908 RepID=A0A9P4WK74_9PLEO|nr:hypothetical protein E8E12_002429 [Didymella heteroderae]